MDEELKQKYEEIKGAHLRELFKGDGLVQINEMQFVQLKKKYEKFKEELQSLDTSKISELYEYLDETNVDRHFMLECILEWTNGNEVVLDDAIEFLTEQKNKHNNKQS